MDLNSEQAKAVNHEDGPCVIIAGAGTGKTKVITSRILRLINSEKAKPQEILALTFTEKAANEMLDRVDAELKKGYYELCIKTFHSFSEQILRESGFEIGIDPQYKISDKFGQFVLFKKHLFDFELNYYRPLGNPTSFLDRLLTYFSRLKDELIKPDEFLEYAKNMEGELEDAEKTLEIAKAYKKYQEILMANGMLDFGDLNFYANELFDKRKSVLAKYQNLFKYILIDEFQDTNYAQFQLILKLAGEHKNICVVGDDDQSIYKWRGASLSNILQFEEYFPDAKKIVLTKNFRSTQNILDASYSLIQNNNPDRLEVKADINKKLEGFASENLPVELHHFPDFLQESSFVAEKIKEMHGKNGISFKDMAILVRSNRIAYPFIDDLKFLQIPYQVKNPKGLFALEEIKDLIAVLKIISNPNDNVAVLRVLRMEIFDIENLEILNLLNKAKNNSLFDLLDDDSNQLPSIESGTKKVHILLKDLIEFSKNRSAGVSINEFLQKSKLLNDLIEKGKYEELDNINEFAKQVAKFEKENKEKSASDFTGYLNLLEEAEMPLGEISTSDLDSVQILTAHGAKGLEFECVFVVNAVNERFPSRKHGGVLEIPESLTKEIYPEGDFRIQEERRLFYVAMTRAKKYLYITYSDQYEGNKKWRVSPFVKEILENGGVKTIEHKSSDDALKRLKEFKEPVKPLFVLPKFKDRRLSYSQFDTFAICPLKYNYRYLMKIPVAPFHAANFGTSVHSTLNEFYKILKSGRKVSLDTIVELYEKNWISYGYESKEHEETRKKQGLEILKNFYEENSKPAFIIPDALEQPFNLKVGEFSIIGRIDRIDKLDDGTFEVIDYKTGRLKDSNDITKDFQLSIYALACRDIFKIKVSKLSLYYLEDGQKISTSRKDAELDALPQKISEKIQNIASSDFTPTPGMHCKFCDFRLICPASYF